MAPFGRSASVSSLDAGVAPAWLVRDRVHVRPPAGPRCATRTARWPPVAPRPRPAGRRRERGPPCADGHAAACAGRPHHARRSRHPRRPTARPARPRRRGTRPAAGSPRRATWPAPARRASRRTTGPGRTSGRAGSHSSSTLTSSGANARLISRSPLSHFDLVDRCSDRTSAGQKTEAADPGVRVPRPRGEPVVWLSRPAFLEVEPRGHPSRFLATWMLVCP